MAFTLDQYNILNAAIAQGALTVEYADKKVTYRSLDEMLEIRDLMANELGLNGTSPKTKGRTYGTFSKGLL